MPRATRPRYGRIGALALAVAVTLTSVIAGVLGGTGPVPIGPARSYAETPTAPASADPDPPLPRDSGTGRRVVLALADQRVWLVGGDEEVRRTYPVSGSVYDNLLPGEFEVFSRSRHATGIDGSTMERMVRFTRGAKSAIGFHDIPWMRGRPVQTSADLGTPLSHGCVRQSDADARAMWRFGRIGTPVVVLA